MIINKNLRGIRLFVCGYFYILSVIFSFPLVASAGRDHAILGVSEHATEDEIKMAFRGLSLRYHPDKNPHDASAEAKFKIINGAYDNLIRNKRTAKSASVSVPSDETIYPWTQNHFNPNGNPSIELQDRRANFAYLRELWSKWSAVDFQKTAKVAEFQTDLLFTKRFFEAFDYQKFVNAYSRVYADHSAQAYGFQNVSAHLILGILGGSLIPKTRNVDGLNWVEYINIYNLKDLGSQTNTIPSQNFGAYFLFDLLHTLQIQGMRSFYFSMSQELFLLMNIYPHIKAIVLDFVKQLPAEFRVSLKQMLADYAEYDRAVEESVGMSLGRKVNNTRLDEIAELQALIPRVALPQKASLSSQKCKKYFAVKI